MLWVNIFFFPFFFLSLILVIIRRYDTHDHSLSDFPAENYDREVFPGQDYSNPRVKDFVNGNIIIGGHMGKKA